MMLGYYCLPSVLGADLSEPAERKRFIRFCLTLCLSCTLFGKIKALVIVVLKKLVSKCDRKMSYYDKRSSG